MADYLIDWEEEEIGCWFEKKWLKLIKYFEIKLFVGINKAKKAQNLFKIKIKYNFEWQNIRMFSLFYLEVIKNPFLGK